METTQHTLEHLFAQLGLPNEHAEIPVFISTHRPLASHVALHEAHFWNNAQKGFLREEIAEDADWAPVVDRLNSLLR